MISGAVVAAGVRLHQKLGPGRLELLSSKSQPLGRVTPCGPVPFVALCANDAHSLHSLSYDCHRICESGYVSDGPASDYIAREDETRTRVPWALRRLVHVVTNTATYLHR